MSVFPPMNLGQDLGFCLSLDIRPSITFVKWMNTHKFWLSKDLHIIKLKVYHSEINSGFPGGSDGKASACNAADLGLIPGSGRSPGEEMAIHFSTLAWKVPWMEEPDRLQSMGSQRVGHG